MRLGTYKDASEKRVVVADVNGIKIGFLNYNDKPTNGKETMFTKKQQNQMLGKYSRSRVTKDIKTAKEMGAEFIVACIHYGTQNSVSVNDKQIRANQYLADSGVGLIVGSHPHLLQKFSYVSASDGRKVPVAFSLGNFCSDMAELTLNRYNIILNVKLEKKNGKVSITNISYTPCCILAQAPEGKFIIAPTRHNKKPNKAEEQDLREADKTIREIIGNDIQPD